VGIGPDGVTTGDRVAAAVEELYGADPDAFTGRRGELAAAARDAGDRAAADELIRSILDTLDLRAFDVDADGGIFR